MIFLSLSILSSLTGCSFLPTPCEQVINIVCDECDVNQYFEDAICECVDGGEVDNAQRYFSSKDAAEISCAETQNQLQAYFQTDEERDECRHNLNIMKTFGDDACDYVGAKMGFNESDVTADEEEDSE